MKGDFSRIAFDAKKHFSQVLLQQGRVTLDADPNEEGAILLHVLRTLARDLIGPYGGPPDALGFVLAIDASDARHPRLMIGQGRYYVDGILVENEADCDYAHQPDFTPATDDPLLQRLAAPSGDDVWVYVDVWERHVTSIEDDTIRESALGGPDTCSRAKVVWQVRGMARGALLDALKAQREEIASRLTDTTLADEERMALQARDARLQHDITALTPTEAQPGNDCSAPLDALTTLSDAQLTARLDPGQQIKDPCVLSPEARYRGPENQLYRVEVHRGSAPAVTTTFKWSRDNGSVATRWLETDGNDLVVANVRGFSAGAWVELSDDAHDLASDPGLLVQLVKVDNDRLSVDPATIPSGKSIALAAGMTSAKVRRWDQKQTDDITLDEGAVPIVEASAADAHWIDLEDGIQVQFAAGGSYRSGDYWLIPARVATGSILWPNTAGDDGEIIWLPQPPRGVEHHYAPLAFLGANAALSPCLCALEPINPCFRARAGAGRPLRGTRRPTAFKPARPAKPK